MLKRLGLPNFLEFEERAKKKGVGTKLTGLRGELNPHNNSTTGVINGPPPRIITNYVSRPVGELPEPSPLLNSEGPGTNSRVYEQSPGILSNRGNAGRTEFTFPNTEAIIYNGTRLNNNLIENRFNAVIPQVIEGGEVFDPANIFLLDGHGSDASLVRDRYYLKENQYALIPGVCGSILQSSYESAGDFFNYDKPIHVFNSATQDNFPILEYSKLSINQFSKIKTKKQSSMKHYRPKLNNSNVEERISVPPLYITPFITFLKDTWPGMSKMTISISGLLRKSESYHFNVVDPTTDKYSFTKEINNNILDSLFQNIESEILANYQFKSNALVIYNKLKEALRGSVLTFDNIVNLAILQKHKDIYEMSGSQILENMRLIQDDESYKSYKNNLTINDLLRLNLPIDFFFEFLNTKTNGPYLLIFNVCRTVKDDASEENVIRKRAMSRGGSRRHRLVKRKTKRIKKRR